MPTDVVLAGVKSARLGRGIAGFSGEGGHGCCTKQACVSSEWMALSQALADKFWALQNQTPLPGPQTGPGPACLGRQEVWP